MNESTGMDCRLAAAVDAALAAGLDAEPSALGYALRRLKAERGGAPQRVVAWESCLLPPPPALEQLRGTS
ncbi:hypothetical protein [Streptomyces sp. H39-S7]|uniref:hypothetical protein n=1 Tax=Streptomyces sp. H39-S7 TaxID=3004357 RepID=UPI0022AFB0AA|nr:hypothetical protein [Streptomyces sp. H39-S7]MCZ4121076.1 hypothetical protein [Streptomyces sp. H39-S7]